MRNKCTAIFTMLMLVGTSLAADYQQALPGYKYEFPRDHFNHEDYQTEWWYYTGNLKAADGHRFGFELTFFRQGINRIGPADSVWGIQDIYLAHLALSDINGQHFYHSERVNRAGPGIAGVSLEKNLIWNGNWQVAWNGNRQTLLAISDDFNLKFDFESTKAPVIHGENGVSQKTAGAGHASHYISLTRLVTKGTVELGSKTYQVDGFSWMDHEFFTQSMDPNQSGWDWVSLQFDDNTELMLYRLRRKDGSVDPFSSGTYVDAAGKSSFLSNQDFAMKPLAESWVSPQSGGRYPIHWQISVPKLDLHLELTTPLATQEIDGRNQLTPGYWEGAIDIKGQRKDAGVTGKGYLEMTGYGKPFTLSR